MYQPPRTDFEVQTLDASPFRGLLIAAPIAAGLWFGVYELVRLIA